LSKVEREDAMVEVLKQGGCILLGEHSRFEIDEESLLTETNQRRSMQLGVWKRD
jgi:hypothetical protein